MIKAILREQILKEIEKEMKLLLVTTNACRHSKIKQFTDEQFQRLTGTNCQAFEKIRIAFPSAHLLNEQIIGCLKRFSILSEKYRNRRKRFELQFNLISAIYNLGGTVSGLERSLLYILFVPLKLLKKPRI